MAPGRHHPRAPRPLQHQDPSPPSHAMNSMPAPLCFCHPRRQVQRLAALTSSCRNLAMAMEPKSCRMLLLSAQVLCPCSLLLLHLTFLLPATSLSDDHLPGAEPSSSCSTPTIGNQLPSSDPVGPRRRKPPAGPSRRTSLQVAPPRPASCPARAKASVGLSFP
ncbi:uncharacterized protein [Triticum aestivum]|uniref:uncharacterized protein n=1 Tax=Triticum aestivum TaxID=4565 RepID=UPI001D025C13|nr:uncharacterized protein LOC123086112 [Triticum aestivum]